MTADTELREQGIGNALAADTAPHRGYGDLCRQAIDQMDGTWTAEDVRRKVAEIDPEAVAHHPNVLPAILGSLASREQIVPVGITRTTRRSRHSSRNLVWKKAA